MDNKVVSINVGGQVFTTTSSTLRSLPNTLLADLIDPGISLEDAMAVKEPMFQVGLKTKKCTEHGIESDNVQVDKNIEVRDRARYVYFTKTTRDIFPKQIPPSTRLKSITSVTSTRAAHVSLSSVGGAETVTNHHSIGSNRADSHQSSVDNHAPSENTKNSYNSPTDCYAHLNSPVDLPASLSADLYVDRSPVLMPYILDAYRLGQLHLPAHVCSHIVRAELDFWKIPENLISECCWKNFHEGLNTVEIVSAIKYSLYDLYDDPDEVAKLSRLGRFWLTLEKPTFNTAAKVWCFIYYTCILTSCICFMLQSVEKFSTVKEEFSDQLLLAAAANQTSNSIHYFSMLENVLALRVLEHTLRAFFTLEFLVRLALCPDRPTFIRNGHNILDLVILVFVWTNWTVNLAFTKDSDNHTLSRSYTIVVFTALQCLRCMRVFHLLKHMAALKVMYLAIRASLWELMLLVVVLATTVLLFGTVMFLVEILSITNYEDFNFANIPIAMWWALITITTVGYGDYYPTTVAGYSLGVACAVTGILLIAMPIAIVASNFSKYYDNMTSRDQSHRRELMMKKWLGSSQDSDAHDGSDEIIGNGSNNKHTDLIADRNGGHDSAKLTKTKKSNFAGSNKKRNVIRYETKEKTRPFSHKSGAINSAFTANEADTELSYQPDRRPSGHVTNNISKQSTKKTLNDNDSDDNFDESFDNSTNNVRVIQIKSDRRRNNSDEVTT